MYFLLTMLTATQINLLTKVCYTEAGGEGFRGKVAVISVVLNRVDDSRWPSNIEEVIKQKHQFEGMLSNREPSSEEVSKCLSAIRYVIKGNRIEGVNHFYAPNLLNDAPYWAKKYKDRKIIGNHVFLEL